MNLLFPNPQSEGARGLLGGVHGVNNLRPH